MFHLEMNAGALASALSSSQTVIQSSSNIAVLKAVYITAADGIVSLTSTNTDQSIRVATVADGDGATCIDASGLYMKASALQADKSVILHSDDDKFAMMTQGKTKWKIPLLDAESFPPNVASDIHGDQRRVDAPKFLSALKSVAVSMGHDASRPFLSGVYFHPSPDGLRLVATDGGRLHMMALDDDVKGFEQSFIIPDKAIGHILKLFANSGGLEIKADKYAFSISDSKTLFKSKMIDGVFPQNYPLVANQEFTGVTVVDAEEFLSAFSRSCAIETSDKSRGVSAQLRIGESEISIVSRNVSGEEGEDTCAAELIEGEAFNITLPAKQVVEAINSFPGIDSLAIHYKEVGQAVKFTRWPNEREDMRIVMPVRF